MTTKQFIHGQILISLVTLTILFMTSCSTNSTKGVSEEKSSQKKEKQKPSMELHSAVFLGNVNALKEHINYGSDLNAKDAYGSTPLNIAANFGKTDIAKMLIDAGADLNAQNSDGGTALHTATFFCRTEIVKALLEAGADKTIKNQYQSTALQSALVPFEDMKPIYEQVAKDLGPLGLRIDFERIEATRPQIAELLK